MDIFILEDISQTLASKIVKEVAAVTGGGGGGKARLAQAGGKHKDKLDEALQLVRKLI